MTQKKKTYCYKLKVCCPFHNAKEKKTKKGAENQVCGAPTQEFACGYCVYPKKICQKHINWQSIAKTNVQQLQIHWNRLLRELNNEARILQARIKRRAANKMGESITIEASH